jgi:hypothetical protein
LLLIFSRIYEANDAEQSVGAIVCCLNVVLRRIAASINADYQKKGERCGENAKSVALLF